MYYVYAIASLRRDYIYVGLTDHVIRRFTQHNRGYEPTTCHYTPYVLIYSEEFSTRVLARAREKQMKRAWGKQKLRKIRGAFKAWSSEGLGPV
ncbi:MAG: GIY-YIG nuclease family protein [Bacteroidia bacterium]|nr:GIY-YIG nuclease family protein [Bacteroidia bacterium]